MRRADVAGPRAEYGMVVDLDRCKGCGNCAVVCAVENNVPPAPREATDRNGLTWLRVARLTGPAGERDAFLPLFCQHCGTETPCATVCPQNAVELDPRTGIVAQIAVRCLGCRYCMTACPYHARSFNWWDPVWPDGLLRTLNPDVSTRTRGVVEKCSFCSHRLQAACAKLAVEGQAADVMPEYVPACVESCPTEALTFGNLADPASAVARLAAEPGSFRLLAPLGTGPKVYFRTGREWVRRLAEGPSPVAQEQQHG